MNHSSPEGDQARLVKSPSPMTTSSFDRSGRGGRSPTPPGFPPHPVQPFDEGQSLAIWRDADVSEPVLAIDLGPERELHLPASHNREIISSRRPICCDDVVEELPRATSGKGNPEKRTRAAGSNLNALCGPRRNASSPLDETPSSFAFGTSRRLDSTLSRRVMKSPMRIDSPRRAIDDRISVGSESGGRECSRTDVTGMNRGVGADAAPPRWPLPAAQTAAAITAAAIATAAIAVQHDGVPATAGPVTGCRGRAVIRAPTQCRARSFALCHRSSGSLTRHFFTTRSRLAGVEGIRDESGGGSCVRIAAVKLA